jgi:hypothetical protein
MKTTKSVVPPVSEQNQKTLMSVNRRKADAKAMREIHDALESLKPDRRVPVFTAAAIICGLDCDNIPDNQRIKRLLAPLPRNLKT